MVDDSCTLGYAPQNWGLCMNRREALRLLATAAVLPMATPNLFATLRHARASVGAQTVRGTLNPHQNATVTAIADMIIPRTETPGASDAGVPAFVDLIVTEWYTDEQRSFFLNGLAEVDERAQRRFSKNFVECSLNHRAETLTELGATMISDAELLNTRADRDTEAKRPHNVYHMLRSLVLTGYYTSEAGATAELNYEVIPAHYDPCADLEVHKKAAGQR